MVGHDLQHFLTFRRNSLRIDVDHILHGYVSRHVFTVYTLTFNNSDNQVTLDNIV